MRTLFLKRLPRKTCYEIQQGFMVGPLSWRSYKFSRLFFVKNVWTWIFFKYWRVLSLKTNKNWYFLRLLFHIEKIIFCLETYLRELSLYYSFLRFVYLKDFYINLKGIGKILFVLVLRILLISKFPNFTDVITKKS